MNEAVLCDKVDDIVLRRHLHCHREVIDCLLREVNLDGLLLETRVGLLVVNLGDLELSTCGGSDGEREEVMGQSGSLDVNGSERGSVTLNGL